MFKSNPDRFEATVSREDGTKFSLGILLDDAAKQSAKLGDGEVTLSVAGQSLVLTKGPGTVIEYRAQRFSTDLKWSAVVSSLEDLLKTGKSKAQKMVYKKKSTHEMKG